LATDRAAYWNAIGRIWQTSRPQKLWRAHSDQVNTALLEQWLPAGQVERLLKTDAFDEASSPGLYPALVRRARYVIEADVSTVMLQAARHRHSTLRAAVADVCRLPFADSIFDVIVSNSTLDHLACHAEIELGLRELYRVLCPGGLLIVTLDNPTNPAIALRNALPFSLLNRLGILPYQVGATMNAKRLGHALRQTHFDVLNEAYVMHHLPEISVQFACLLERHASHKTQSRYLRLLMSLERLGSWPTRTLTGYFVAMRAVKMR